ncbi:uracil-DNA glycosylase family protein [Gaetbulibacter sp. PBL-D1]|uniref:uracil-DNA glycosylase family protein n=1 Tax=Gaetbulibacter sp. PBL-D1 TaxID=3422594 RepID=UPI003D2ED40A
MFFHKHPYQPFIQNDTTKLIVGTLPPPRFSTGELLEKDVDFCYGSYYNSLWLFIDKIHNLNLRYDNSQEAIEERKRFLIQHKIGVCDIVESAERKKIDASDLGMTNIVLRDLIGYIKQYPTIDTLLFTGGNSKNGPEYFFRKHIKDYNIKLKVVSNEVPRIHEFVIPIEGKKPTEATRKIKTVSLTSGSGAANISISRLPLYKQLKAKNPDFNTFDFRVMQYSEFF